MPEVCGQGWRQGEARTWACAAAPPADADRDGLGNWVALEGDPQGQSLHHVVGENRVAVEKLDLSENRPKRSDQKCIGDRRKSFIGHPDATHFRQKFCERVFQQLRLFTTTINSAGNVCPLRVNCLSRQGKRTCNGAV